MKREKLGPQDALLIVDVQNDFCPGGKLAIQNADQVIPVLNQWAEWAEQGDALIVASRCWHPKDHISFKAQGGPWPEHCVQQTKGAELHPDLHLPSSTVVINKGTHPKFDNNSAFDHTELAERLRASGVGNVWIGGLALDVCVEATALDALSYGFRVFVLTDATKPVNQAEGERVLRDLKEQGVTLIGENQHAGNRSGIPSVHGSL